MSEVEKVEFRVRAVTRYVVTGKIGADSPHEKGEYANAATANQVAEALAAHFPKDGYDVQAFPYEGPPPGKVMRCKVRLDVKIPAVQLIQDGSAGGRMIETEGGRKYPDNSDPANYRQDGENLTFNAVWGGADPVDGYNACHENRIFSKMSPHVNFQALVRNPDVLAALKQGAEYYVDFIEAPKR